MWKKFVNTKKIMNKNRVKLMNMYVLAISSLDKINLKKYVKSLSYLLMQLQVNYKVNNVVLKKQVCTVLRSPHKYKRAREQYIYKKNKTVIELKMDEYRFWELGQVIRYNTPASINVVIKKEIILSNLEEKIV